MQYSDLTIIFVFFPCSLIKHHDIVSDIDANFCTTFPFHVEIRKWCTCQNLYFSTLQTDSSFPMVNLLTNVN